MKYIDTIAIRLPFRKVMNCLERLFWSMSKNKNKNFSIYLMIDIKITMILHHFPKLDCNWVTTSSSYHCWILLTRTRCSRLVVHKIIYLLKSRFTVSRHGNVFLGTLCHIIALIWVKWGQLKNMCSSKRLWIPYAMDTFRRQCWRDRSFIRLFAVSADYDSSK